MAEAVFKLVTLGDLIDSGAIHVTTGFPFGDHNVIGDGVPHIRPFNVGTDGEIYLDQIKSIPTAAATGKPQLRRDDIVFNNTNTKELVGKCALWLSDEQPVFSNHMTRIRVVNDSYDPAFLSFAILHHWMTGKSEMLARSHVAQASIIGSRFREIEVPWPEPAEQRSIGSLIRWVRVASRSEANQLAHAALLKRAVMAKLFTLGLGSEAQKETDLGLIPESWSVHRLGQVCKLSTGTTPATKDKHYYEGDIPFIKTADVINNRISTANTFISQQAVDDYSLKLFPAGTVLMAMYGQGKTRGQVSLLEFSAATTQNAAAIQPSGEIDSAFLWHYLMSCYERLRGMGSLGHVSHLNLGYLRELLIVKPPLEEQREIASILDAVGRKNDLHKQRRAVLESLFKSLLHQLLTGEISVSDLDLSALSAASMQREEAMA